VLAYDFTENQQFVTKTDRNNVFLGRDPHIADRLYRTVPYMSFFALKKIKFLYKIHVLAYDFAENRQFVAKTDRNSVFLIRDPHIAD
jgi:hypothetical protein